MKVSAIELAGCAQDSAGLARLLAKAPMRPKKVQEACDVGLFSDQAAQLDLVELARMQPAVWECDAVPKGWKGNEYYLVRNGETLVRVKHCGHPTALRPYYVTLPSGEMLERKFSLLADAKAAAIAAIGGV